MAHLIKETFTYLKYNALTLALFELIHKLLLLAVIVPSFFSILTTIMQKLNMTYLSAKQAIHFCLSPSVLILGFFMIICLGYVLFLEVYAILLLLQAATHHQKLSLFQTITRSLKGALSILAPRNLLLLLFLTSIIPISSFLFKYYFLKDFSITEFLFDLLYQRAPFHPVYFLFISALALLNIRFCVTLQGVVYQKLPFIRAAKESVKRSSKTVILRFYTLNYLLLIGIAFMGLYGGLILISALAIKIIHPTEASTIFINIALTIKSILTIIAPSFFLILMCAFIHTLYLITPAPYLPPIKGCASKMTKHPILKGVVIGIFFLIGSGLISPNFLSIGRRNFSDDIQIIAHRGSATYVPENTLAALDYSIQHGADMAEIDVQMTKDKEVILMHDSNLKRTSGYDQKVTETTYQKIRQLEVGGRFDAAFFGEPIPTLEEALKKAKGKLTLMIEIKVSDDTSEITKKVIELIEAHNMEDECLIGSMDYRVLQVAKMINPDIQTVYITALAYGDYQNLKDVDYYSIEASFISYALISQVHHSGKQIYAWTVNKEATMQTMIAMQVDGIVTDNPTLLKKQMAHLNDHYIMFINQLFFRPS